MDGLMDDVKPHNFYYYQEYLNQKEGRKGENLERKIQRTIILGSNIHTHTIGPFQVPW